MADPQVLQAQSSKLLTIQTFPSSTTKGNNLRRKPDDTILSVHPSSTFPPKFLVQHYHPSFPSSARCPTFDNYLIDLSVRVKYDDPLTIITAIQLATNQPDSFSPCLAFGTNDGRLYLTRSNFSRPYSQFRQLHRSPVVCLTSCPLNVQPTILISGSSTEILLWDLDIQHRKPICLRAFGRQNLQFASNPYSSILFAVQLRQVSSEKVNLIAEFKDGLISCWDLKPLLALELPRPEPQTFSQSNPKSPSFLDACCVSTEGEKFHVYSINPEDDSIEQSDTGRKLCQLSGPVSRLVCIKCDHQTRQIEFLALLHETQKLMKIAINDASDPESPIVNVTCIESDCILFHYDRMHSLLATAQTANPHLTLRQMDQPFQLNRSYSLDSQTWLNPNKTSTFKRIGVLNLDAIKGTNDFQISSDDLIKYLKDELDQNLKFPSHLRLAIYKRLLIQSKSDEERLSATFYRCLAFPSPELFLKKFRAAWKLEQAEFQFSLETLLTIFHGIEKHSEAWLIDKLAPILYSFLKILENSKQRDGPYQLETGEEYLELIEIFQVCQSMIARFGGGAFDEKGASLHDRRINYQAFVENVTQRLLVYNSSPGRSLLDHLARHAISIGKDCLPRLTHGFCMGFTSPESFESLMDHLVIGHLQLDSIVELSSRLLEHFSLDIMRLSAQKEIISFFSRTHVLNFQSFKTLSPTNV